MSKGLSNLYSGTSGYNMAAGSTNFMDKKDNFSKYIKNRKDIDTNGFYDVIAHGSPNSIQVYYNGKVIEIDHRLTAKLLKNDISYRGGPIRLLSFSTGADPKGFAQNLANKLNVVVSAPTDILWSTPSGRYFVAGLDSKTNRADMTRRGKFVYFYPGGKKK